ncbi:XdhC family protein [Burkholderia cenocepacia]|nr:XdhC family protein [Burkholderia cenocepacia]RQZ85426.1 XdhC family protein [Burkholderia cenocepacia]RRA05966.1 XdhC family protein [Burkholderia cenocepacia]
MENIDVVVLRRVLEWRTSGHRCMIATVTRTWGSSPRPVGSIMGLAEHGEIVGSVSGGCIEDDLIQRYSAVGGGTLPRSGTEQVVYGVTADEAYRFGLPCGGTLELTLEFDPPPEELSTLVSLLDAGFLVERVVYLPDGKSRLVLPPQSAGFRMGASTLHNVFGPSYRMLLIGATQMTDYVAAIAITCGFSVVVCDPRTEYQVTALERIGVQVTREMPDEAVVALKPDRRTCVIALTHDPKLDDMALLEALHSPAFYVGAIGSRGNAKAREMRLREHFDFTEESIAGLHSPVGIYIGSKTPAEIAVSLMAEVLAAKNGVVVHPEQMVGNAKRAESEDADKEGVGDFCRKT